jgi:hypothetical protein
MNLISQVEKSPMQSKKFLAYLLSNLGSKILTFWMVEKGVDNVTLITIITATAFIDVGYILGQAALDKYVRVASMGKE